jgi:hypothetical protein
MTKVEQLEQLLTELSIEQSGAIQVGRFIIQPIYGGWYYSSEDSGDTQTEDWEYNVDTECMMDEFEYAINNIDTNQISELA